MLSDACHFHKDKEVEKEDKKKLDEAFSCITQKVDLVKALNRECELTEKLLNDFSDDSGWEKTNKGENFTYGCPRFSEFTTQGFLRSVEDRLGKIENGRSHSV